jgi:hypothetical protein
MMFIREIALWPSIISLGKSGFRAPDSRYGLGGDWCLMKRASAAVTGE